MQASAGPHNSGLEGNKTQPREVQYLRRRSQLSPDQANAAKAAAKKAEKTKAAPRRVRQSWNDVMQEASGKPHKTYSMSGSFGEGDWIEHSTFGLGCVQSFVPPNKITVRFADSTRLLICNQN